MIGARTEVVVALDWTDFDADGQSTIVRYLVTAHGRALPLVWMSVDKAQLKDRRNEYEDAVPLLLREVLPFRGAGDRPGGPGVGDQKLYELLTDLRFAYIIRRHGVVLVESRDGERHAGNDWVPANGQIRHLTGAQVAVDRRGMDRMLKVSPSKKRTHSLFRQGCHFYASIPAMRLGALEP